MEIGANQKQRFNLRWDIFRDLKLLNVIKFTIYHFKASLNNLVLLKTNLVLKDQALWKTKCK